MGHLYWQWAGGHSFLNCNQARNVSWTSSGERTGGSDIKSAQLLAHRARSGFIAHGLEGGGKDIADLAYRQVRVQVQILKICFLSLGGRARSKDAAAIYSFGKSFGESGVPTCTCLYYIHGHTPGWYIHTPKQ